MHRGTKWVSLFLFLLIAAGAHAQDTAAALAQADQAFGAGEWAQAVEGYQAVTRADPKNARAWFQMGVAHKQLGRFESAVAAFEQSKHAGGFGPPGFLTFWQARSYAAMGNKEKAFESLRATVAAGFSNLQALDTNPDLAPLRDDARFAEVRAQAERNAQPCAYNPEYRKFDFWLGEWNVSPTGNPGQPAGVNVIELILNKCIIYENWTGANGYTGKSFNLYNAATKKWEQIWVDAIGGIVKFEGEFQDGVLHYYADTFNRNGSSSRRHLQFIPQGPDQVRQFSQQSTDGGKTWSVEYDLTYVRKKPAS